MFTSASIAACFYNVRISAARENIAAASRLGAAQSDVSGRSFVARRCSFMCTKADAGQAISRLE